MQDDFPKVDLTERGDLDHVLEQIRKHSLTLLRDELRKAGQSNDRKVQKTCEETIELVSDHRERARVLTRSREVILTEY